LGLLGWGFLERNRIAWLLDPTAHRREEIRGDRAA